MIILSLLCQKFQLRFVHLIWVVFELGDKEEFSYFLWVDSARIFVVLCVVHIQFFLEKISLVYVVQKFSSTERKHSLKKSRFFIRFSWFKIIKMMISILEFFPTTTGTSGKNLPIRDEHLLPFDTVLKCNCDMNFQSGRPIFFIYTKGNKQSRFINSGSMKNRATKLQQ